MLTPASHYLTDGFAYIQASDIEEMWLLGFFLVVGYILEVTFFRCIMCYCGVFFLTLIANCSWLRELWDIAFQKNWFNVFNNEKTDYIVHVVPLKEKDVTD